MNGEIETRIKEELTRTLSKERWGHTLRVAETAAGLAAIHGIDPVRARIAGLLHDYAREMEPAGLLRAAAGFGLGIDPVEACEPLLLHGKVGAALAHARFGLTDPDLLAAVAQHITGAPGMTRLAAIIFLADFIEPGRPYAASARARTAAQTDLGRALLITFDAVISYVVARGYLLHPRSLTARNELLDPKSIRTVW